MKSNLTRAVTLAVVTALLTAIAGCGNKGPLVPPKTLVPSDTPSTVR
jgi:predicted small lipoprotein YifL